MSSSEETMDQESITIREIYTVIIEANMVLQGGTLTIGYSNSKEEDTMTPIDILQMVAGNLMVAGVTIETFETTEVDGNAMICWEEAKKDTIVVECRHHLLILLDTTPMVLLLTMVGGNGVTCQVFNPKKNGGTRRRHK